VTPQAGSSGGAIAVLPPAPNQPSVPTSGSGEAATGTPAPQSDAASAETTPQPATPTTPITSGASAPTAPYRVSVGAFGSEANAQAQAEAFRQAGFPVFLGRQSELVLVLVGPYDTQGEAEQAVARIRTGNFGIDPVIYRFQPDDADDAAATPPTPATAPAETTAPAVASDGTFLQVGAYATRESALPQIQRLEALGFDVAEQRDGGLLRLLVGPFDSEGLARGRERLQAEGIENFPR
jgi:cell division protein FtsN